MALACANTMWSRSLTYIYEHYKSAWRPNAFAAYYEALGHLSGQLKSAQRSSDEAKVIRARQRIEILDAQIRIFELDTPNLRDATRSVKAATADVGLEIGDCDRWSTRCQEDHTVTAYTSTSTERRLASMPFRCLLICMRQRKDASFAQAWACNLETDRQS